MARNLQAQDPQHILIGSEDLSNVDVYGLVESAEGSLYITSNFGMYVYNHGSFSIVPSAKEQVGKSLFQPKLDQKGQLFCCNYAGQIFQLKQGRLTLVYQLEEDKIGSNFSYFFDDDNHLVCASKGLYKIDLESKEVEVIMESDTLKDFDPVFSAEGGNHLVSRFSRSSFLSAQNQWKEEMIPPSVFQSALGHSFRIYRIPLGEDVFWSNQFGEVFDNQGEFRVQIGANEMQDVCWLDTTQTAFFGEHNGITILDENLVPQEYFQKIFVSAAFKGKNGVVYLGTFKHGIIVIPDLNVMGYHTLYEDNTGLALSSNGDLFISTKQGKVVAGVQSNAEILDSCEWSLNSIHYIDHDFEFENIPRAKIVYADLFESPIKLSRLDYTSGILMYPSLTGVQYISNDSLPHPKIGGNRAEIGHHSFSVFNASVRKSGENCVALDPQLNSYYTSDFESTIVCTNSSFEKLIFKEAPFVSNDLACTSEYLICGTDKDGVLIFQEKEFVRQIRLKLQSQQPSIIKLVVDTGQVYVLASDGVYVIDLETFATVKLDKSHGLIKNDVIDLAFDLDHLWLLKSDAVIKLPKTILFEDKMGGIRLDSLYVNDERKSIGRSNDWSYNENNLDFFISVPNMLDQLNGKVMYQLNGHQNWISLPAGADRLSLQSLSPGEYKLQFKLITANGESELATIDFVIHPPFWQQWWFYALLSLLVTLAVVVFYKRRLRKQAKEAQIKNELSMAKLTAIQSQMNPHFIFNALNSIQHLVIKGDTDKSYDYLTRFANLVRRTLDYSEKERIQLSEEIQLLEVYLKLEKLRFIEEFDYEILYDEKVINGLYVPPMLVQPFIENALVHGLLHKKGLKRLKVKFEVGELLTCVVEDNGIGRERAKEIRQRQRGSHQSFALDAIKRRFEILEDIYHVKLGYLYEDVKNDESVTTRVIIKIPLDIGKEK